MKLVDIEKIIEELKTQSKIYEEEAKEWNDNPTLFMSCAYNEIIDKLGSDSVTFDIDSILKASDKTAIESRGKEYQAALEMACKQLIERPEALQAVLVQYDNLVKQANGGCENMELPYWCYGFCGKD